MNIVAPAGNMERFYAAVKAGADEIYMGLKGFGARRNAENFTLSEYKEALDYAHERGVRILLTLNTVMRDSEIEALYQNLKTLYEYGLDAVIVQDLGLFRFIKDNFPDMDLHGSTQMTVANHVEANYLKKIGFSRVVLARELSFDEIKSIKEKTEIELEIFVSGALCISYSGNCYLSSFIGGRSGNRGLCAQPCRKEYETEDGKKGYFLSPKDQMMGLDEVEKYKDIGIESIKLEGRMKSPTYVFETVNYYRSLIRGEDRRERTSDLFNRGYSKGYFYPDRNELMNTYYSSDFGKCVGDIEGKELKLKEPLTLGDGVSYVSETFEKLGGEYVRRLKVKGEVENQKTVKSGDVIILGKIPKGSRYVYKNYSKDLNDEISRDLKQGKKRMGIYGSFMGKVGEKASLELWCINKNGKRISVINYSEDLLEKAAKKVMSIEDIKSKISESGDTTFYIEDLKVNFDGQAFTPLSLIKGMRRDAMEELGEKLLLSYRREADLDMKKRFYDKSEIKPFHFAVVASNLDQKNIASELGIDKIYMRGEDVSREGSIGEADLESPLACNLYQILENKNEAVTANWNMNITNSYALEELGKISKIDTVILSPELSFDRIKDIGNSGVKKGIMIYGKLKGMFVEIPLFKEEKKILKNEQGDLFEVIKTPSGKSELFLKNPMNIISRLDEIGEAGIDEMILEFTDETADEVTQVIESLKTKIGDYNPYNFQRGVY
jgi:putative protease